MSDRPTPLTDAREYMPGPDSSAYLVDCDFSRDLERKLAMASEALEWARDNMGKHTRPSPIDKALASINGKGTT